MSLFDQYGDASDANAIAPATHDPLNTTDTGVAGVAALADDLEYTLTVEQVLERIASAGRKPRSERTIERYCSEGRLAAKKITLGSEWLINESSLTQLIEAEPIVIGVASVVASDIMSASATPTALSSLSIAADTADAGVVSDASRKSMATPVGEERTTVEVLIENARLLAQVEGRDAIIGELKEERSFLREELREARRTRDDVRQIAERMLETLKTIAVGRSVLSPPPEEPTHTEIINLGDR